MQQTQFIYYAERSVANLLYVVVLLFISSMVFALLQYYYLMIISCLMMFGGLIGLFHIHSLKKKVSLSLTHYHLQHHSNKGGWCLQWSNLSTLGIPQIGVKNEEEPLAFIGL